MEQVSYGPVGVEAQPGTGPVGAGLVAQEQDARARRGAARYARERGMVSAEWAVGIIAAVAIAGVLLAVVTTGQVKSALLRVILTVIGTFAKFAG